MEVLNSTMTARGWPGVGVGASGAELLEMGLDSSSSATDLPNGFYSLILFSGFAHFSNKEVGFDGFLWLFLL